MRALNGVKALTVMAGAFALERNEDMGLDIGMVDKIEWTPRPGWVFWDYLSPYALDVNGNRLTLEDARNALGDMKGSVNDGVDTYDIELAREFVNWCEDYWRQRGYGPDDGISIVLSY